MANVPTIVDLGICLRRWEWSETSQTAAIFSREHGLMRVVAKGARRPGAAFSGGLEAMTLGQMTAIVKPSGAMANLTSWDLREAFAGLRSSLRAFHASMYIAEVALRMVVDHDPHPSIFGALERALGRVSGGEEGEIAAAVLEYQWGVLVDVGYRPRLSGGPEGSVGTFDPERGGLVEGGSGWKVRRETIELLRRLDAGEPSAGAGATIDRASRLVGAYLRHLAGAEFWAGSAYFGPRQFP